jgi:ankyrin repeat protein
VTGTARLAAWLVAAAAALPAAAQVAPSPAEVAAYRGLHAAAHRGDAHAIAREADPKAMVARDANGRTPLHVATFARQRGAIEALLRAGADPAALDHDRYDAVTVAAVADDEESLRVLLARGASAKLVTSRYDGTALIAAAHLGHDGVVRQLIAAGAPRHQAVVKALLDAGASTKLADRQGRTPLALARERGFGELVRMLEAAGAR